MSMNMPLRCDEFTDRLADYLEGDLPESTRAIMEAHAAGCAECGPLLADIEALRVDAAALPPLAPSRELWSGIAERIDARVIPMESPLAARIVRRTWLRPAIAAAALVAFAAGVSHLLTRAAYDPQFTPARRVASTVKPTPAQPSVPRASDAQYVSEPTEKSDPTPSDRPTVRPSDRPTVRPSDRPTVRPSDRPTVRLASAEQLMKQTEPVYDREIARLRRVVKERRGQLDPKTVAVLEQSIAVIDSAIAQSRAALAKDPASGFLANQLNHSLEKKVELLRTAALLPART